MNDKENKELSEEELEQLYLEYEKANLISKKKKSILAKIFNHKITRLIMLSNSIIGMIFGFIVMKFKPISDMESGGYIWGKALFILSTICVLICTFESMVVKVKENFLTN